MSDALKKLKYVLCLDSEHFIDGYLRFDPSVGSYLVCRQLSAGRTDRTHVFH